MLEAAATTTGDFYGSKFERLKDVITSVMLHCILSIANCRKLIIVALFDTLLYMRQLLS